MAFVTRNGMQLMYQGKPWRFFGAFTFANMRKPNKTLYHPLPYSAALLDRLVTEVGLNAIRVFVWQYHMTDASGAFDYSLFDDVIAQCRARNIKIVACCDGDIYGYRRLKPWYQGTAGVTYKTAGEVINGYAQPKSSRQYTIDLLTRYAAEDTIAMWEVYNEPLPSDDQANTVQDWVNAAAYLRAYYLDMCAAMKAAAPNHLIGTGTMANPYDVGLDGGRFVTTFQAQPNLDAISLHSYSNPTQPSFWGNDRNGSLDIRCANARAMGIPLYMGEMGALRWSNPDGTAAGAETATTREAQGVFVGHMLRATLSRPEVVGLLYWAADSGEGYQFGSGEPAETALRRTSEQLGVVRS